MKDSDKPQQGGPAGSGGEKEPEPNLNIEPPPLGYISKGYHPDKPNPLPRVREGERKPEKK